MLCDRAKNSETQIAKQSDFIAFCLSFIHKRKTLMLGKTRKVHGYTVSVSHLVGIVHISKIEQEIRTLTLLPGKWVIFFIYFSVLIFTRVLDNDGLKCEETNCSTFFTSV